MKSVSSLGEVSILKKEKINIVDLDAARKSGFEQNKEKMIHYESEDSMNSPKNL